MSFFPTVAKNTLVQVLGRGGVIFTTVITTAFLTRSLGTTGYGNYIFIISLILFLVTIADWGTGLIFVREAAKFKFEEERFFGNALFFRLAFALICLLFVWLLIDIFPQFQPISNPMIVASLLLLLISLKTTTHVIFQTKLRFEFMAFIDVFISLIFLVFLLLVSWILKVNLTLFPVIISLVFANLVGVMIAILLALKLSKIDLRLSKRIIKKIFVEAIPTGALLIIFSIYNRVDIFILQLIKGPDPVGIYGLSYKVHDNLVLGAAYLTSALFPVISGLAIDLKKNRPILMNIYQKSFDLLFLAGATILLMTLLFTPIIIAVIGGPEFQRSILALRILVFATFFAYLNHLTGYTLIALGKQRISLAIALVALVWNVGLNLILIPRYSYVAAAAVTITTEGLVFILTSYYLVKKFGLAPSFTFFKTTKELIKTKGKIF